MEIFCHYFPNDGFGFSNLNCRILFCRFFGVVFSFGAGLLRLLALLSIALLTITVNGHY